MNRLYRALIRVLRPATTAGRTPRDGRDVPRRRRARAEARPDGRDPGRGRRIPGRAAPARERGSAGRRPADPAARTDRSASVWISWQDWRGAWRRARAQPAYSGVVISVLALGIAVNTVIFSVADATLFRGLPYPNGSRMFELYNVNPTGTFFFPGLTAGHPGRVAPPRRSLFRARRLELRHVRRRRRRRAGADRRRIRDARPLWRARGAPGAGPSVRRPRRRARARRRRDRQRRDLAPALRLRSRRRRTHADAQRSSVHRRRRDAAALPLSSRDAEGVAADAGPAGRRGPPERARAAAPRRHAWRRPRSGSTRSPPCSIASVRSPAAGSSAS